MYVSENVLKIWGDFRTIFRKKFANFLNGHDSKGSSQNQLKLFTQHKYINMYQKM